MVCGACVLFVLDWVNALRVGVLPSCRVFHLTHIRLVYSFKSVIDYVYKASGKRKPEA